MFHKRLSKLGERSKFCFELTYYNNTRQNLKIYPIYLSQLNTKEMTKEKLDIN